MSCWYIDLSLDKTEAPYPLPISLCFSCQLGASSSPRLCRLFPPFLPHSPSHFPRTSSININKNPLNARSERGKASCSPRNTQHPAPRSSVTPAEGLNSSAISYSQQPCRFCHRFASVTGLLVPIPLVMTFHQEYFKNTLML